MTTKRSKHTKAIKKKVKRTAATSADSPRGKKGRNKGYDATHQAIIDVTVRLISEKGAEALSIAAVARAAEIDRTTLYYHFADREALLATAKEWSSAQLTLGFIPTAPRAERTAHISRFVLENPELIKLWIGDFISPGNIRHLYPQWDALVSSMAKNLRHHGDAIDAEVYCTIMLTAAFIAPRVYKNSVRPDLGIETIIQRFASEQTRVLMSDTNLPEE
jgi:AcrR family transcriptional regulator